MERAGGPPAVRAARVPVRLDRERLRLATNRLGSAVHPRAARWCSRRRDAALRQIAFLRRVRVRLGVGRGARASRHRVLPQAAERNSVHPGPGPSPPGFRKESAPRSGAGAGSRYVLATHPLPARRRPWAIGETRVDDPTNGAVPLAQRGLRRLRRFPAPHDPAASQEDPAGTPPRAGRENKLSLARRTRYRAKTLGVLQSLLSTHLRRAPLHAISEPRLFLAHRSRPTREPGARCRRARRSDDRLLVVGCG